MQCYKCGSEHVVKNGKSSDGGQRYRCQSCGRTFTCHYSSEQELSEANKLFDEMLRRGSEALEETSEQTKGVPQYRNISGGKAKKIAIALALLNVIGIAGIHRFYVKKNISGIIYLFTFGLCGIGTILDIILILTDNFKDKKGNKLI